jgi:hypothetical protein
MDSSRVLSAPTSFLGVRALGPLWWRFAFQGAVEEVVVPDREAVADLPSAEARPSQGDGLFPSGFAVGVLAAGMCHGHTVRAECSIPGSNSGRFTSSGDTGWFRCHSITECVPGW